MKKEAITKRPPVIGIFGHIDHGKSTLLDYIRKTNITEKEAGGITQHIAAYEVEHDGKNGEKQKITFLDTPGHEAFRAIRRRGTSVADIAVLIVSAEDGVKPQTIEALEAIKESSLPFVVAINKIDKPGANIDRTKQDLAENNVFLEGYGGSVSFVAISAKTGEGVDELLDLLLLTAELEDLKGDTSLPAEGIIVESNVDPKKGIAATVIIKNGTLLPGKYLISGTAICPVRIVEDFRGKPLRGNATFSSPVRIYGWDNLPQVGEKFEMVENKKEALARSAEVAEQEKKKESKEASSANAEQVVIPIILKADTAGSLEAVIYEIGKLSTESVIPRIVLSGVGSINENDIKTANTNESTLIVGFNIGVDPKAQSLSERLEMPIHTFDIIYKLTEWFAGIVQERTPAVETEEIIGEAKVLKTFSRVKNKQVLGGKVLVGTISVGDQVKIVRRDAEIGTGKIREMQSQKIATKSVDEGNEFGMMIESKTEAAPGDKLISWKLVRK